MKRVLAFLLFFSGLGFGQAADIYLNPIGVGLCAGHAVTQTQTFFNTSTNWGTGPTQIGPGTTVHICGTFTGGVGATIFTFQGNGSLANPLTFKFEPGSSITAPAFGGNGAIYGGAAARSNIIIDGNNTGTIITTDNGSPGAFGNSIDSAGIFFTSCTSCEIKGFKGSGSIGPIYQHTSAADNNAFGDSVDIHGGSNNHVHDLILSDASHCTNFNLNGTQSNLEVDHLMGHRCNWITSIGSAGNITFSNFSWHDNEGYDWFNWDTTANTCCHHNGLHLFLEGGTGASVVTNVSVYNNYGHGDPGIRGTAFIYLEGNSGTITAPNFFNNVCATTTDAFTNGCINTKGSVTNPLEANNDWVYPANLGGNCVLTQGGTNVTMKNDIFRNCGQAFFISGSGTLGTSDFNDFFGTTNFGPGAAQNPTFAGWKSTTGGDANSVTTDPKLDASFVPQSGSGAIGLGTNLFSTCTGQPVPGLGALCNDKAGLARPSVGAWDAGAYNFTGAVPAILISPNPFNFGNVNVGSTSSQQIFTVQNTGTATLHLTSETLQTGTQFSFPGSVSLGDCIANSTLAPGNSCTKTVFFAPTSSGAKTDNLVIVSDASSSPDLVPLSGTGVTVAPAVTLSPTTLSFGNQTVLVPSSPLTVHLTNSGAATLNISSIALAGVFNANNVDNSSSGWRKCWAGGVGPENCAPGGSGTVTSGPTQTFGNATPSLDGSSEKIAFTGTAFTDVLFIYEAGAHNTATRFQADYEVYITPGNYQDLEFDTYQFLHASLDQYMFGSQCQTGGFWQVWNSLLGTWNNTTLLCSLPAGVFHHITWNVHRVAGDTSCASGHPCMHYDTLTIDGVVNQINITWPAGVLPGTFADQTGLNFQMDTNSSGGAVAENLDYVGMAGATDYSISSNCGPTLGAGSSCDVLAYFTPSSTGLKSDSIVFTTNASTSPDSVPITGTGVNAGTIVSCRFSGGVSIKGGVQCK